MTQTTMLVGPRGWAALTLAGGSVLAMPFLRSSQLQHSGDADSNIAVHQPDDSSATAIASFRRSTEQSVMPGRRVAGVLPATRQLAPASDSFDIPTWAQSGSKLDELITSEATSLPTPQLENLPSTSVASMQPWTEHSEMHRGGQQEPRLAASEAELTSQFSMRPVLPPAIVQPRHATLDGGALRANSAGVVQMTAMSALPDYSVGQPLDGHAESGDYEQLPAPVAVQPREHRLANPPRQKAFVYQPGMPRE